MSTPGEDRFNDSYFYQRSHYDAKYSSTIHEKYLVSNQNLSELKYVFEALRPGHEDKFLDIGTGGSGWAVIETVRIRGCDSIGIDLSSKGAKRASMFAKKELGELSSLCQFLVTSATHLPFKDRTFTKVSCLNVLEHVEDDELVNAEMSRVLKPGNGRVLIEVPNTYRRYEPLLALLKKRDDRVLGHLRTYQAEALAAQLRRHGLFFENVAYHTHLIRSFQSLLWTLFPRLRRPDSRIYWMIEGWEEKLRRVPTGCTFGILTARLS